MRRFLKITACVVVAAVLAAATLPWWIGGALALARRPLGLEYARYERVGYNRFALEQVRFRGESFSFSARRLEADTPLVWWWHHVRGGGSAVAVDGWKVEVRESRTPAPPNPKSGWRSLHDQLRQIAEIVESWLPVTRADAGEVSFPGGKLEIASATWNSKVLTVDRLAWRGRVVSGKADFSHAGRIGLALATEKRDLRVDLESTGAEISGTVWTLGQPIGVTSRFPETGWLPQDATARAEKWDLEGAQVGVAEVYSRVKGDARVDWKQGNFVVDVAVQGEPLRNDIPRLELALHGRGSTETFSLEELRVEMPGARAHLTEAVRFNRAGELLSGPSRFLIEADLAKQPWGKAEGRVTGEARIGRGAELRPNVDFSLQADAVKLGRYAVSAVRAAGTFDWPRLQLDRGRLDFSPEEHVDVSGTFVFGSKEVIAGKLAATLKQPTVHRFWSSTPSFKVVTLNATAEGPLATLKHSGTAKIEALAASPLDPVSATIRWRGLGEVVGDFALQATSAATELNLAGAADRKGISASTLRIQKGETTWLRLEKPARIDWAPFPGAEPVLLSGQAGRLELAGRLGPAGSVRLRARDFSTGWLRDILKLRGPEWKMASVDLDGSWTNGPMAFKAAAVVQAEVIAGHAAEIRLNASGDRAGITIEELHASEEGNEAFRATGRVPVTLTPAKSPYFNIERGGAISFKGQTNPNAALWAYLAQTTGVALEQPELRAELSGTPAAPQGSITFRVPRVSALPGRFKQAWPTLEQFEGELHASSGAVELKRFAVNVAAQRVELTGRVAMPADLNRKWDLKAVKELAGDGTLHLRIPDAELAALSPYAPALIAPKGRLAVDLTVERGSATGFVRVSDAASRPLGPLGVLQDVNADLEFVGRSLRVRTINARMGGQPLQITGRGELADDGLPHFSVAIKGENLPFVRQVGLLLRGDLDLQAISDAQGGRVTGSVTLRNSLFSSDVRDFIPRGGGGGAARRPPYFAFEAPPFNTWRLDVELKGSRFLRMRTPIFNGVASMQFRLSNTLGEPRAVGQAKIDEGGVTLPFATFAVQQGSVRLTESNPYEPALFVTGTSRRYGYDLRMEVSGAASAPVLQFSSSPPLTSEQVLLLVMAGELPNDEISYSSDQKAMKLGAFLGRSLLSSVRGGSGDEERLTLSTGERISRQGRETYTIEYRINPDWALVGEYDEFDDYNAGVKWRVLVDKKKEEEKDNAK